MNQIQVTLLLSYFLMSCYFFTNWLRFSLRHPTSTPEEKFLSFVMFLVTTILWPVVIIMNLWQIFNKRKLELSNVIPVIFAMFAFSLSYYLTYWY
ncbi:hypothetical protein NWP22_11870 [Anabaenopsis tanganyikae CS-531]|uniref:Uncharacterized protein n=2 Tax=Anabaenopsis TaxID=110103 RepID=A0ABT5AY83_9CYAN|nr:MULTISPECIES: hypothetical protein [Anabaenopsis]MDB9541371.1 hypothetical protein [Anabaenopsis arnoldii]MDH6090350.1 hypothetical protein [Anabaenopsis arnoldii]MDH6106557.1 hypothetical protein [Anabaenopsis tanganyikae CS-531]